MEMKTFTLQQPNVDVKHKHDWQLIHEDVSVSFERYQCKICGEITCNPYLDEIDKELKKLKKDK